MSRVSGTVELVRLMVLRGEVPAGARVVEVPIADELGVPRTVLREALRRLEGEGLLTADEDGGMHVVALDAAQLAATVQVRAALEALAARQAAERASVGAAAPSALRRLAELAAADGGGASAAAQDAVGAAVADRHFHRAVSALSGNHACHDALAQVWDRLVVAAHRAPHDGRRGEHAELAAAIRAGDAEEAESLARRHVLAAAPAPRR